MAVGDRELEAGLILINTGGRPAAPDVEGLDRLPTLDSTSIMELDQVPEHLAVMQEDGIEVLLEAHPTLAESLNNLFTTLDS